MTDETIFAAALEKTDPAERSAFVAGACGADAERRRRVEGLLAAHEKAATFLERPAVSPPDPGQAATRAFNPEADADATRTGDAGTPRPPADSDDEAVGFLSPPRRPDSLGRLGHYEILQVLGRGGFGIVFRAFDDVLQRVVAVKVLAPQMAATSPARKRFLREARSGAQIHHENVVQIYATEEQPLPYLVMEFVPGETLQHQLDRNGPLDVPEVLRIGRQIAEGLAAAHGHGLIHRDVKPANVLLDGGPQERVKLTDFGLARAADDASISQSGVVAGTPMYMAPEQARGDTLDHRADLFSLGSVLYAMLTGRPPFRATTTLAVLKRVAEDDPRPIREVIPEVPEWLCRVVEKLHAKNPDDRFQSAREVADLLADAEQQVKAHGALKDFSRIPGGKPTAKWRRQQRIALAAAAVACAAVAVAGVWRVNRQGWENTVHYIANRATVRIDVRNPNVESIAIWRDGVEVETLGSGQAARTWQPGQYAVVVTTKPGFVANRMTVQVGGYGPGGRWQRTREGGNRFELPVLRGGAYEIVEVGTVAVPTASADQSGPLPSGATAGGGWGEVVNPLGDCKVEFTAGGWLTMTIPGDGKHNLNPLPGWFNVNAPRVVREVEGDFDARVVVRPFPLPEKGTTAHGGSSYVGAGLVIWQDDGRILRLFRSGNGETDTRAPYVHAEWFPGGASHPQELVHVLDTPTHLNIRRTGNALELWYSTDGKTWVHLKTVTDLPLAGRIKVGVAAVNSVKKEFAPMFEGLTVTPATKPVPPSDGFVPLFNGKDLTGWKTHDGEAGGWHVGGGVLVGTGTERYLFSDRSDYRNFHLKVEAKISTLGNSGVHFRSELAPSLPPGYEAQINVGTDRWKTGSLFVFPWDIDTSVLHFEKDHLIAADEWFTLEVLARGPRIEVLVNGKTVADVQNNRYAAGHIALQGGRAKTEIVQFRKIEIQELPPAADGGPSDRDRLQGRWRIVSGETAGKPMTVAKLKEWDWLIFSGDDQSFNRDDTVVKGTYRLNTATTPKQLDFVFPGAGTNELIYRFEGDTLVIAEGGDNQRPTAFQSTPTNRLNVLRFLRESAPGVVPLFNGLDLTGWKTHPDQPDGWSVRDGVLVGSGKVSHLFSTREYGDFHLRAEVKINRGGNGGVHFRTGYSLPWEVLGKRAPAGYEIQVNMDGDGQRTGSIYDLKRVEKDHIKPDEWFTLEVIARGNHITSKINGVVVADVVDQKSSYSRGHIALQSWYPNTVVQFRKIEIKELLAAAPTAPPREVPTKAADVLPFLAGNWKVEREMLIPKPAAGAGRDSREVAIDWVAGGKVLRGRGIPANEEYGEPLVLFSLNAGDGTLRRWFCWSGGATFGPIVGAFNPINRTLLWMHRLGNGHQSNTEYHFVDPDTFTVRLFELDTKDKMVREVQLRFTRTGGPVTLPTLPADPNRPAEMKVLDRLAGEWRNEITVTAAATPDKPTTEVVRATATPILGGRFVEVIEANETTKSSEYTLAWFDAEAKRYRQWFFHGDGYVLEFTGTWDEATKTLTWASPDGTLDGKWVFKSDDERAFRHAVKDKAGQTLMTMAGVSRRVVPAADPAVVQPLRDLVAAKEKTRDAVKARVAAGQGPKMDLVTAEVDLIEARARLAQAEQDKGRVVILLQELVAQREEEKRLMEAFVKAGVARPEEMNQVEARLADAKARLAQARADLPKEPAQK